jgi:hypothetical protein
MVSTPAPYINSFQHTPAVRQGCCVVWLDFLKLMWWVAVADCCLFIKLKSSPISSFSITVAGSRSSPNTLACPVSIHSCQPNHLIIVDPLLGSRFSRFIKSSWCIVPVLLTKSRQLLAVSVCPLTSIQLQSTHSINAHRSKRSLQLHRLYEAVFAKVDWFPPSILPKTITMALLCCHGIMVHHTIAACDIQINQSINQWQCQLLPHQSFMGLGRFIASSSNCSS